MHSRSRSLVTLSILTTLTLLPAAPAYAGERKCGKWDNMTVDTRTKHSPDGASTRVRVCGVVEGRTVRGEAQAQAKDTKSGKVYERYELRVSILEGKQVLAKRSCVLTRDANEGQEAGHGYSNEKMQCELSWSGAKPGRSYKVQTLLVLNKDNDGVGNQTRDGVDPVRVRS